MWASSEYFCFQGSSHNVCLHTYEAMSILTDLFWSEFVLNTFNVYRWYLVISFLGFQYFPKNPEGADA
jgi:hypothetical protein